MLKSPTPKRVTFYPRPPCRDKPHHHDQILASTQNRLIDLPTQFDELIYFNPAINKMHLYSNKKAPNWDALTRAHTKEAILEHEYLSYDQNPGLILDSYNAVWAKAQKGWDTKGWAPEDWEMSEVLWVHLLQNTMKEVKADPLLTKKLGTGGTSQGPGGRRTARHGRNPTK